MPHLHVVSVAETGGAVLGGSRLALPVDQAPGDGVVAVAGSGREAAAGLVEGEDEGVGAGLGQVLDPFPPRWGLATVSGCSGGGQDLDAGVAGVDLEGYVGVGGQRSVQVVDLVAEHRGEFCHLGSDLGMGPHQVDAILEGVVAV